MRKKYPPNQKKGRAFARPSPTGRYEEARANSITSSQSCLYRGVDWLNDNHAAIAALPPCAVCMARPFFAKSERKMTQLRTFLLKFASSVPKYPTGEDLRSKAAGV
jgi:hypothetical protein